MAAREGIGMSFDKELELMQAIERVRELHKPIDETNENGFVNTVCSGCYDEDASTGEKFHDLYPCPTIKALDGEQG